MTPEPGARGAASLMVDPPSLHRYEMWVRTVVSPALVAALPVRAVGATLPRQTLHRLQLAGDRDVPSVLQRLAECGVEVLLIRAVDKCA